MRWHLLIFLCLLAILEARKGDVDYYKVFDMTRQSFSKDSLHRAYRKLAKQHHPDKNKGNKEAEEKFVEITKAFEVLNDDQKRKIYDQFGAEAVDKHMSGGGGGGGGGGHPFGFHDAEDIFNSFFGGGGGGGFEDFFGFGGGGTRRANQKRRSQDAKMEMRAPLASFYKGATIEVEVGRQQLCPGCKGTGAKNPDEVKTCVTCKGKGFEMVIQQIAPGFVSQSQRTCQTCGGRGKTFKETCSKCSGRKVFHGPSKLKVKIEPGMPDGVTIKFPNMSDEHPDAEVGDLYVVVRQEKDDDDFTRNGQDLYTDVSLTLSEALLGFKKELEHLDGHKVILTRDNAVVQPDQVQTIRGEGMPAGPGGASRKGDLYVKYKVVFPQSLDKEQTALLSQALRSHHKDEL